MIEENKYSTVKLPSRLYDEIEQKVVSLYQELSISSVPIDPFEIAKRRGYIVKPFSSFCRKSRFLFIKKDLDGINYYDPELGTFVICYDESKSFDRIRFTLMHEIGHIDMGHREESELARKMADFYAAYALAPSPLIAVTSCDDYMDVAKKFKVSQMCADICFQRFLNWEKVSFELKPYEKALVRLFQNK